MQTYFIRHTPNLLISEDTRRRLVEEARVAIHYPDFTVDKYPESNGFGPEDNRSLDPADHRSDGAAHLRRLLALAEHGGYVCAEYHGFPGSFVGLVRPGSKVEHLEGLWSDGQRVAVLKTVKVEGFRHVTEGAAAAMIVARPRRGTFMRWHKAGDSVKRLLNGEPLIQGFDDLTADAQELMCSEFLRTELAAQHGLPQLVTLLLPTGRTQRNIDILGLSSDGKRIAAQVTHSPLHQVGFKVDRLKPYVEDCHAILFCDTDHLALVDGVTVFPIRLTFEAFVSTPSGKEWLKALAMT